MIFHILFYTDNVKKDMAGKKYPVDGKYVKSYIAVVRDVVFSVLLELHSWRSQCKLGVWLSSSF